MTEQQTCDIGGDPHDPEVLLVGWDRLGGPGFSACPWCKARLEEALPGEQIWAEDLK